MNLPEIRKALVPAGVAALLGALELAGITEGMTVAEAVTYAVTSGLVWLIPNRTPTTEG